jgi:predicted nucleic acid-binding protein
LSFLVDTNVISELRKGSRCAPEVSFWFAGVPPGEIYLSALTIGELRRGIESLRRRDEISARSLEAWLQTLLGAHSDRILPVTQEIAEQWGRLNVPDPLPVVDGLLAATASVHSLTLVTRNVKDVERTGIRWINPFQP